VYLHFAYFAEAIMKQAAMYVRVSTTKQKEEATIESQKSSLQAFCKERGYEIPSQWIFEDNGISGASLARPALDKLRDLASEGFFDCLFVLSPDRLSRKYAHQAVLIEEFKKNGVSVCFESSPPSNSPGETLLEQMQSMFAEYERAQITERTRRGKQHKARSGCINVLTKAPYGYRYICATTCQSAYFTVHDAEARVVRTIFELYTKDRLSAGQIIKYLAEHQIPSPKAQKWGRSSIGRLLTNSAYRGIAYFGVRKKAEIDPMRLPNKPVRLNGRKTPRRSSKESPANEWIPISVPPIISEDIFKLAQELKAKNKLLSKRNTKVGSLLQGLLVCKECGYSFVLTCSGLKAKGNSYYRCSNRDRSSCKNQGIRTEQLDESIWMELMGLLSNRKLIEEEVSRRISELKREPLLERKKLLNNQQNKLQHEANRLLDAFQEGCIEMPDLKTRMQEIKREINNIRREIAQEPSGLNQEQLMELNTAISFFSDRLKDSKETLSLEEKRRVLRILVKDIQIGVEDIDVNHILPFSRNSLTHKNARLRPHHWNDRATFSERFFIEKSLGLGATSSSYTYG
jgi:site-specific DNA recombinase